MQLIDPHFKTLLRSKYLVLLISLLTMMLTFPLMDEQILGKLLFVLFFLFTLVGIFYGIKGNRNVLVFMLLGLFTFCINLAEIHFKQLDILSRIISIVCYAYAIILFCKDIYTSKQITTDILLGSICVYLLIGVCFALTFMILQLLNINTLIHQATALPIHLSGDFYYFSFITLATVGFGDIVAQTGFAKSVAMLEGIVGIFYIAIMVARLVSVFKVD
jgi:voltage-gated potassium channel